MSSIKGLTVWTVFLDRFMKEISLVSRVSRVSRAYSLISLYGE